MLTSALCAGDGAEVQRSLAAAYEAVAAMHNALGITEPMEARTRPFWNRSYPVILADRFVTSIRHEISAAPLRELPLTGSVDQFVDSTDVLARTDLARAVATATFNRQLTSPRAGGRVLRHVLRPAGTIAAALLSPRPARRPVRHLASGIALRPQQRQH